MEFDSSDSRIIKNIKIMAQYIDKADIEKILSKLWKEDDGHNSEHRIC